MVDDENILRCDADMVLLAICFLSIINEQRHAEGTRVFLNTPDMFCPFSVYVCVCVIAPHPAGNDECS